MSPAVDVPATLDLETVRTQDRDFEAAVSPWYGPLVRRLVLVLGDAGDAEDVAQETYLRAYRDWRRFDGHDVRAWLYTIALHLAFDHLRRRRRWLARLARPQADGAYTDHADPDLWAAVGRLEPRIRAALLANVLDGYTQREIAGMLSVAEGTVASWLSRARASLREDLIDLV
ncbi:MAG TPA: RNA polymerase sigma factor [Candidatus Saccharimonadia bacterium]|nr:RNA polymerase sigma factor [Candidatus Saccharimonadia bacterium]